MPNKSRCAPPILAENTSDNLHSRRFATLYQAYKEQISLVAQAGPAAFLHLLWTADRSPFHVNRWIDQLPLCTATNIHL
jgi:hypothetical protein